MSFRDGKRWIATQRDIETRWGLDGKGFRCSLCGHKFQIGDGVRFQYARGATFEFEGKTFGVCNFKVCDECDGPDVLERWIDRHKEFYSPRFWALR